jgi:hypothetical protein
MSVTGYWMNINKEMKRLIFVGVAPRGGEPRYISVMCECVSPWLIE